MRAEVGGFAQGSTTFLALTDRRLAAIVVVDELRTDDTCGYSHNGVAKQHDDSTEEASQGRHRCDVAITDRRHRHHRPIDTAGNILELRAGPVPLDHIHQRTQRDDHQDDEEEEDQNLAAADHERAHEIEKKIFSSNEFITDA